MATANDIITAAFGKIEVSTFTTAQADSALINLNNMVSMLGADGLMYAVSTESFTATVADPEYTIGSGADWDTARPINVISCYLRDSESYDWPVKVMAGKDYAKLSNKSWSARPSQLYFLPEYPSAKIIFDAAPDYAYTVVLELQKNFTEFAATTTTVTLPNEYKEALVYNLAVSLGEDWGRNISNTTLAKAEQYKEIIASLIASQRKIPRAKFDFGGFRGAGGDYSITTDDTIDGGAF
jgi:hypothetical protein